MGGKAIEEEAHVKITRLLVLSLGVVVCGAGASAVADAGVAAAHHGHVNCHGGTLAAGTYASLRVSGACTLVQSGNVTVRGNVVVTPTGLFNAGTPAKLRVGGDVIVQKHGATAIGCSPDIGCATLGADVIRGSIHAQGAAAVIVHGTAIGGNATIKGGGRTMDCSVIAPFGAPYYSVMEDSTIRGNLAIRGLHTCWLGVIRNHVGGTVRLIGNRFGDPDADEVVTNVIGGNLACFNNIAAPHVGDSTGLPNVVGGQKRGECKGL
jgi:hypothetical protein